MAQRYDGSGDRRGENDRVVPVVVGVTMQSRSDLRSVRDSRTQTRFSGSGTGSQRDALDAIGSELISRVVREVSLTETERRAPHLLNRLGSLWWHPVQFRREIAEMLLDERARRGRLSAEVRGELVKLQAFYTEQAATRIS